MSIYKDVRGIGMGLSSCIQGRGHLPHAFTFESTMQGSGHWWDVADGIEKLSKRDKQWIKGLRGYHGMRR